MLRFIRSSIAVFVFLGLVLFFALVSCHKWDNPYDSNALIKLNISVPTVAEINSVCSIELSSDSRQDFNARLELYKGGIKQLTISENEIVSSKNDINTIQWKVPTTCVTGGDYRIKVTSIVNESLFEYSDYFLIANWADINAVNSSIKTSFFIEDFNNNVNGWSTNVPDLICSFSSGVYQIQNTSSTNCWIITTNNSFDISKNFQIELRFKYTGPTGSYNGFCWGADANFYKYSELLYLNNSAFQFGTYISGNWNPIFQSNSSPFASGYNTLIIRKISGSYYFFVNNQYLGTINSPQLYSGYFGFETYTSNTTIYLDYLYFYYINL